jgi:large subunit ribosomal protein L18
MKYTKAEARKRRHFRVRNKITGTPEKPRLNVFKSNTYFYAQIIDDKNGKTLVASSSLKMGLKNGANIEAAKAVAKDLAEKAKTKKIATGQRRDRSLPRPTWLPDGRSNVSLSKM